MLPLETAQKGSAVEWQVDSVPSKRTGIGEGSLIRQAEYNAGNVRQELMKEIFRMEMIIIINKQFI